MLIVSLGRNVNTINLSLSQAKSGFYSQFWGYLVYGLQHGAQPITGKGVLGKCTLTNVWNVYR